jgi:homoserine O-succinyltransferase
MTVVLPKDYHAITALTQSRILCISTEDALKEDIRALRIGILNIMPRADTYEFSLLHPLGRSVMQIEPVWIRLDTHTYSSTDPLHLEKLYVPFKEAVDKQHLDGLIVTGAPVEEIPFEEVSYWNEIQRILRYAQKNIPSTLGICWGGLALAKFLGIEKTLHPKKIFGVFESVNLDRTHPVTGEMDDRFWCAQSRHAGIGDNVLEMERDLGKLRLLACVDQRFLIHLGHPEYEPTRLIEEYYRDKQAGRADVEPPANLDLEHPANTWRSHRTEFFSQWIKYIHETRTY